MTLLKEVSMKRKYSIRLPNPEIAANLGQDEAYFDLDEEGKETCRLRFHDYGEIFSRPGLYEHLFHRHLRCASPRTVVSLLEQVALSFGESLNTFNVLDVGAGNGMVAAELLSRGVNSIVGLDILPEARAAAERDRPRVYDEYFIADLTNLDARTEKTLRDFHINCLVTVAALGFGDIPPEAFLNALNLTVSNSWIALNLKDTFFDQRDESGFATLIKKLMADTYLQIHHVERYRHRLSVAGAPLYYYAFICRKVRDIPQNLL
jgi:SAM-dependent methyltransferase